MWIRLVTKLTGKREGEREKKSDVTQDSGKESQGKPAAPRKYYPDHTGSTHKLQISPPPHINLYVEYECIIRLPGSGHAA